MPGEFLVLEWQFYLYSFNSAYVIQYPCGSYTGVTPAAPPGNIHSSPSEDYWSQVDLAGARQAVNLVNGVIVDGLGHVSLDSGVKTEPNIHQGESSGSVSDSLTSHSTGSIPATGRREASSKTPPASSAASSATSLPFNQLIGGAVSPSLINTTTSQPLNYATTQTQAQVSLSSSQDSGNTVSSQAYPVIGDYAMIANNLRNLS